MYFLANRFVGSNYNYEEPSKPVWEGIYHPDFNGYNPTLTEYIEKKIDSKKVTVGLWFHQSHWQGGNTSFIDFTIREIEPKGLTCCPSFSAAQKTKTWHKRVRVGN
jgi:cobaltochelatase CobN